ncbi:MAG: OmpH family outer membrane protein [Bacteroidia bacterium]
MKKLLLSITLIAATFFGTKALAQKYGHVDAQAILFEMAEMKQAQTEIERYRAEKERELKDMFDRYQQSVTQFQADEKNLTPEIKNSRLRELQEKEQIIQQFQQDAEQKLQQKEVELLTPLREKVLKAIEKVAMANNYTYIFDASALFYAGGEDVGALVRKELGITATPATPTPGK